MMHVNLATFEGRNVSRFDPVSPARQGAMLGSRLDPYANPYVAGSAEHGAFEAGYRERVRLLIANGEL